MITQRLKVFAASAVLCGALGAAAINGAFAAPNNETPTPAVTPSATAPATSSANPAQPDGHRGLRGRIFWGMGAEFGQPMADFLGISTSDLRAALKDGQTLAQIGQAHGKSADDLKGFLKDQLKARLDEAVKNGKLTADQETELLDKATANFDKIINAKMPQRLIGPRGPHGAGKWRVDSLQSIAGFLGISASDLRTELQGGKTLAEAAQAHGKSAADLKSFLMDQASKRIDDLINKKHTPRTPVSGTAPGSAEPTAQPTATTT